MPLAKRYKFASTKVRVISIKSVKSKKINKITAKVKNWFCQWLEITPVHHNIGTCILLQYSIFYYSDNIVIKIYTIIKV